MEQPRTVLLFVLPIGIFRMFSIPQWTAADNDRNLSEVIVGWGRGGGPLQRPCIPRIISGGSPTEVRPNEVHGPASNPSNLEQHSSRNDQIPHLPSAIGFIGIDTAWHPEHAGDMHEVKRQMEADQEQPEVPLAQGLIPHPAGNFGVPVIKSSEDSKDKPAHKHIVEMGDNEVRVPELPIEWRGREHDARQPSDQKLEKEGDAKQHRDGYADLSAPHRA